MKPSVLLVFLLLAGCRTSNPATTGGILRIEFGNAGGFTGAKTTYALDSDGQVFKDDKTASVSVRQAELNLILKEALELQSYQYNAPGNMYSFLQIRTRSKESSMVWVLGDNQIDQRVISLYNKLMELVSKPH